MSYLAQLYADNRTVIAARWTDVLANGIWETEHEKMIPWGDFTLPKAAICIPSTQVSPDWGVANQVYQIPIQIYYAGVIAGDSGPIRLKLEALRDDLLANTVPSTLCVLDVTELTWSDTIEANVVLMAKNYNYRAGRLTVNVLAGTMAT